MADYESREGPSRNLQDILAAPREEFRLALEQSAESLRRALADQQKVFSALKMELPDYLQGEPLEPNRFMPITTDFVSKAYERARELFDDLEIKIRESDKDEFVVPLTPLPAERARVPQTADMMTEATWYLNDAMRAVIEAMDKQNAQKPGTIEVDVES